MNVTKKAPVTLRLLALVFVAILASSAANAQVATSLERLEVAIWPEYDQPGVLVMLTGWLPADSFLPTYVPLPLPAKVTPTAVAERDPGGTLLNAAHTLIDRTSSREVRIAATNREIRVEYYVPLEVTGTTRSFDFEWPGLLALDSATYQLQHPVGATDLSVSPEAASTQIGFDGLTYSFGDLGSSERGETFEVEVNYEKTSPVLTLTAMQGSTPAVDQPPPASPSLPDSEVPEVEQARPFPWIILIPVLLIAGLIVGWFLYSSPDS